jgi:hypothetical protein
MLAQIWTLLRPNVNLAHSYERENRRRKRKKADEAEEEKKKLEARHNRHHPQ